MGLRTELVFRNGKIAQNTMENGLITPCKARDTTSLPMEASMKVIGLTINSMDKENKPGQMVEVMRVHSIMESKKVKEYMLGLTVRNMTELGLTVNSTERVLSQLPKEKSEEVFGRTEFDLNGLKKLKRKQILRFQREKTEKNRKPKKSWKTSKIQWSIMQNRSPITKLSKLIITRKLKLNLLKPQSQLWKLRKRNLLQLKPNLNQHMSNLHQLKLINETSDF